MTDALQIQTRRATDEVRIELRGELDLSTAPLVGEAIRSVCATAPRTLVVDLADLSFCDSSGLREFVAAAELCLVAGAKFRIEAARPPVRRVFDVSGLGDLLEPEDTPN